MARRSCPRHSSSDLAAFSALIQRLSDAALDAGQLSPMAAEIAAYFDSESCALQIRRASGQIERPSQTPNYTPQMVKAYQQHYHRSDAWVHHARRLPRGAVALSQDAASAADRLFAEFYGDWLPQLGVFHCVGGVQALGSSGDFAGIGVHRARRAGVYRPDEALRMACLLPHIQRSLQLRDMVSGMKRSQNLFATVEQMFGIAVIVAAATGRLLHANATAEVLLRTGRELAVRDGLVVGATSGDTARLHKLLRGTGGPDGARAGLGGSTVKLTRPGSRPVTVYACPVPRALALDDTTSAAMLFITHPEQRVSQGSDLLKSLYGLTAAQVRLLYALLEGDLVKTYASKHGVSVNTVKSHLKQIFAKTGFRRQTDLFRGLMAHPLLRGTMPFGNAGP